jgi:hypothetical protein
VGDYDQRRERDEAQLVSLLITGVVVVVVTVLGRRLGLAGLTGYVSELGLAVVLVLIVGPVRTHRRRRRRAESQSGRS